MQCEKLDINVILTDPDNEDVDTDINLQLLQIRDKTLIDGQAVGAVNIDEFTAGLKQAIINYAAQFGDVDEYE